MTREEQIEKEAHRVSYNTDEYHSFIQGAEWADKSMIENACNWMRQQKYQEFAGAPLERLISDDLIDDFVKSMEE